MMMAAKNSISKDQASQAAEAVNALMRIEEALLENLNISFLKFPHT